MYMHVDGIPMRQTHYSALNYNYSCLVDELFDQRAEGVFPSAKAESWIEIKPA